MVSKLKLTTIFLSILVLIIAIIFLTSFTIIDGGYQGVVFSKVSGVKDITFGEGFHFKTPLVDSVIPIEVRNKKVEKATSSTSQDQQVVETEVALNYRVRKTEVNKLYQEVGLDYENRVIVPALQGSVKTVMAQYVASDLIQKRDEVSLKIKDLLQTKLNDKHIDVINFELTNLDFSETYDAAIEAKVKAEQQALQAKNELERIKIEAEQKVVQAEASKKQTILEAEANAQAIELKAQADAKAIQVIQEQLKNSPNYVEYLRVQNWDGVLPKVVSGGNDVLLSVSGE